MTQTIRILVVDDDLDILNGTARLLEKAGYTAEKASGGAEALNVVQEHRPDLLLLDRDMPGIDGVEVCRQIKRNPSLKDTLVILTSGKYTKSDEQADGLESGADGYIVRPIANRELLARVESYARIIGLTRALHLQAEELRREIDERTRAEVRIKWLASFPEQNTNPIFEVDLETDVLHYANPASIRLFPDLQQLGLRHPFLAGLKDLVPEISKRRILCREMSIGASVYSQVLTGIDDSMRVRFYCDDITERKNADARILYLNRVYAVLSDINKAIVREKNTQVLFQSSCRIAVEKGLFRMAWIGLLDETARIITPVASAGAVDGYLETTNIDLKDDARRLGPTAQAILSGEHQICTDIAMDPLLLPWRDEALKRGYRSSGSFPLKVNGQTIGAFMLYAVEPFFFDASEVQLLDEMAMDIGFAMEVHRRDDERKRVEASHTRLATAVEQASETIVITDTHGTIVYANPAFEKSTGYTLAESIGQNPRVLKSGKQDAFFYRKLWETVQRGDVWHGHFSNKRKDGTLYEEDATISPIRDASGAIVNYVAVKRDVTREMQLDAQFRQSQKMEAFGLLAGGVAHDFNNILSVVLGYSEMWLMKLPPDAPVCGALQTIKNAGERAAALTRQLLAFSRKSVLEPKILDLNGMVDETKKMLVRMIGEDIQLVSNLDPGIPRINIDPGQISQVLINLAVNARDAMPHGGSLTFRTGTADLDAAYVETHPTVRPGRYVMLSICDTGCGMPPETLARIFEPFFTTKGIGKGTGLGLAVVHGVVTQSGGSIQVESQVGVGTTFKLYFPVSQEVPQSAKKSKDTGSYEGDETILVVDDEGDIRQLAQDCLQSFGYTVLSAESGQNGLMLANSHTGRIDLVLTDVVMPGMSGREMVGALKQSLPKLKVIFMSGYTDDSVVRYGVDHEAMAFLQKPLLPFYLLKKVREVLDKKS